MSRRKYRAAAEFKRDPEFYERLGAKAQDETDDAQADELAASLGDWRLPPTQPSPDPESKHV